MKEIYYKREQDKIKELAKEYIHKGYEVFIQPSVKELPNFLKKSSFQPDLIVRSEKENLVIEVKSSESISSAKNLEQISNLIKNQQKWDFMLVLTNPKQKSEDFKPETIVSPQTILRSFQKVEELLADNFHRFNDVALLYLWSVIEAVLRFGLSLSYADTKIKSIKSLLRDSQVLGVISKKDYDLFSALLLHRNAISHGFFDEQLNRPELDKAVNATKRIFNELNREYLEEDEESYINYLRTLTKAELETEIDSIIGETSHELLDQDEVNSQIAMTNAFGWYCDDYSIENIELFDNECIVTLSFHASGDQDEDKVYHGTSLSGRAEAVIDVEENVYFQNVTAALETYDDDYET